MKVNRETRKCLGCGQKLLSTYKGIPKKYCNRSCIDEYRRNTGYFKRLYEKQHPEMKTRKCIICKRIIKLVGERKNVNKYCSKKCMFISSRMKAKGQTEMYISIPIEHYHRIFEGDIQ